MFPLNGGGAKNWHALEGNHRKGRVRKQKIHMIQENRGKDDGRSEIECGRGMYYGRQNK